MAVTRSSGADDGGVHGPETSASNLVTYKSELDNWDRVIVVRYPGRRKFFDLLTDPDYLQVMPYKAASAGTVLTPVTGGLVIPDLRWPAACVLLTLFLLVGWIREAAQDEDVIELPVP